MRKSLFLAVALPLTLVACGRSDRQTARENAALQRDLKLAATSTIDLQAPAVNPANFDQLETAPQSALHEVRHLRRAPGLRAIRSATPTLRASEIPAVAETDNVPQIETVAAAPVQQPATDPVATMPRPSNSPQMPGRAGEGQSGNAGRGGIFGGWGPVIGVVLRGGGADGDHCEPHGPRAIPPGIFYPGAGVTSHFPVVPRGGGGTIFH